MKTRLRSLCLLAFSLAAAGLVHGQGTAFTYQGRLNTNGTSPSGLFDLRLAVFDISGPQVGPTVTNTSVGVTNGLFTTLVDLAIRFSTSGINTLRLAFGPRTPPTRSPRSVPASSSRPAPKANYAYNAGNLQGNPFLAGAPTFGAAGPPFYVNSTATVANLSADLLDGLDSSAFWKVGGNAGTAGASLGTVDNQPMKLGFRELARVVTAGDESGRPRGFQSITAVNVLGGANINTVAADGGDWRDHRGRRQFRGGRISDHPASKRGVGLVSAPWAAALTTRQAVTTVDPGTGRAATVSGGENNGAFGDHSFVGGG